MEPATSFVGGLPCDCAVEYDPSRERLIDAYDAHIAICDRTEWEARP